MEGVGYFYCDGSHLRPHGGGGGGGRNTLMLMTFEDFTLRSQFRLLYRFCGSGLFLSAKCHSLIFRVVSDEVEVPLR